MKSVIDEMLFIVIVELLWENCQGKFAGELKTKF
jgi:hypothetical protein